MAYLNAYAGDIDFGDLTITSMEGIGWARKAKNINLEGLKLTSGEITEIPDSEFNACTGLEQALNSEKNRKKCLQRLYIFVKSFSGKGCCFGDQAAECR